MDLQNNVPTSFSPRFNSFDNGVNKSTITSSTRTIVESEIGAAEKSESVFPADSNVKSDPRLKKDLLCKSADEHLDLSNKKLENTIDNKVRKSPPKSVDISCPKSDLKVDSVIKSDSVSDDIAMVTDNKLLTNEIHQEECNLDVSSVSLGTLFTESPSVLSFFLLSLLFLSFSFLSLSDLALSLCVGDFVSDFSFSGDANFCFFNSGLSEPLFISDLELSLSVLVGEALVLSMDFVLSFLGVNSDLHLPIA
jgi:hypothetical protein